MKFDSSQGHQKDRTEGTPNPVYSRGVIIGTVGVDPSATAARRTSYRSIKHCDPTQSVTDPGSCEELDRTTTLLYGAWQG